MTWGQAVVCAAALAVPRLYGWLGGTGWWETRFVAGDVRSMCNDPKAGEA